MRQFDVRPPTEPPLRTDAVHRSGKTWICCQLGAREHYAIPRALQRAGALAGVITDAWIPDSSLRGVYPRRLRQRFHEELAEAFINHSNLAAILFEAQQAVRGAKGWDLIIRRNDWFQDYALRELARLADRYRGLKCSVFSFSYTARKVFEFAHSRGWTTILGQIDPGPQEERIVDGLHRGHPNLASRWYPAPRAYWESWYTECQLADRVVVNSSWSREALLKEGIPEAKIRTVPLAYQAPAETATFQRSFPQAFTAERRLRVLFLGQVGLRKGVAVILDAIAELRNEPVEFWFVGPCQIAVSSEWRTHSQVRWVGGVPREAAARYYRDADIFLFPTFSDGFGITQLEAQAWKLPLITSKFCGQVVRDGFNGVLLNEMSGKAIAKVIRSLLTDPVQLASMSGNSGVPATYSLEQLSVTLLESLTL